LSNLRRNVFYQNWLRLTVKTCFLGSWGLVIMLLLFPLFIYFFL